MKIGNIKLEFISDGKNVYAKPSLQRYAMLAGFLNLWNDPRQVRNTLIPYIEQHIQNGAVEFIDEQGIENIEPIGADPLCDATVDREITTIQSWGDPNIVVTLSSKDFLSIANEWLSFLELSKKN